MPIWHTLDALPSPARIAFASGWDDRGHLWYRSPLLGAQLQHEVLYISSSPGDTLVDYREDDKIRALADRALWLQRMLDREIDILVLAVPQSVEREWVLQLPEIFVPFANGEKNLSIAFEIRRDRLATER